jgi:ketosteroid isomerase-like protein
MSTAASIMQDADRMIRALEADFERNANARDISALTEEFYANDAQLMPPNAPTVQGKAAIRDFWTAFFAAGVTDAKLDTHQTGASGDLAYSIGAYGFTLAGVRHAGKYLVVWRKEADGGYKCIADSFSDNA